MIPPDIHLVGLMTLQYLDGPFMSHDVYLIVFKYSDDIPERNSWYPP